MLSETLMALAATAGAGLVNAMVTDVWQEAKRRTARLLGRGDEGEQGRQEDRLERARRELLAATDATREQVLEQQKVAWRTRFEDLIEDDPAREAELQELVKYLSASGSAASSGVVQVNANAFDRSQQVVQGQGSQTINLAPSREPHE